MSILLDLQKLTFPESLVFSCASLLPALPKLNSTFSCKGERSSKWNSRMQSQARRNEKYTASYYLCPFWSRSFVQRHKELQKHKGYLCVSQMQSRVTFTHLSFLFLYFFTLHCLSWTVNTIKDWPSRSVTAQRWESPPSWWLDRQCCYYAQSKRDFWHLIRSLLILCRGHFYMTW